MLTVVSSPPSPLLKNIPIAHPVGPFAQYLRDIYAVLFTPTWDAVFAINSKAGNHQAENGCTVDEKQKNESTHEITEPGRLIGVSWGGCRLLIPVLLSIRRRIKKKKKNSFNILLCHDLCKSRQEIYTSNNPAENRSGVDLSRKGKTRSNSRNHLLLLRVYRLERKPSFMDFWHRRCLDSLFRKPSTAHRHCFLSGDTRAHDVHVDLRRVEYWTI